MRCMTILVSVVNQTPLDSRKSPEGAAQSKPEAQGMQESKAKAPRKVRLLSAFIYVALPLAALCGDAKPVSYFHDVVPILKRSCTGCHQNRHHVMKVTDRF